MIKQMEFYISDLFIFFQSMMSVPGTTMAATITVSTPWEASGASVTSATSCTQTARDAKVSSKLYCTPSLDF